MRIRPVGDDIGADPGTAATDPPNADAIRSFAARPDQRLGRSSRSSSGSGGSRYDCAVSVGQTAEIGGDEDVGAGPGFAWDAG